MTLAERIKPLRLVAFDVDGVLTDGGLYLSDSGEETQTFQFSRWTWPEDA